MFSTPTFGSFVPSTAVAKAAAMRPKCSRFSGVHFTFAPQSITRVGLPTRVGRPTAMPGRRMPSNRPSRSMASATTAPVLPADTTADTSPLAASAMHRAIDESRLWRTASTGASPMPTTCEAWHTVTPLGSPPWAAARPRIRDSSPTSTTSSPSRYGAHRIAPSTWASGAESPPIASTAMRMRQLSSVATTSRPAYWPQLGHTRCGSLGVWQLRHGVSWGTRSP